MDAIKHTFEIGGLDRILLKDCVVDEVFPFAKDDRKVRCERGILVVPISRKDLKSLILFKCVQSY